MLFLNSKLYMIKNNKVFRIMITVLIHVHDFGRISLIESQLYFAITISLEMIICSSKFKHFFSLDRLISLQTVTPSKSFKIYSLALSVIHKYKAFRQNEVETITYASPVFTNNNTYYLYIIFCFFCNHIKL